MLYNHPGPAECSSDHTVTHCHVRVALQNSNNLSDVVELECKGCRKNPQGIKLVSFWKCARRRGFQHVSCWTKTHRQLVANAEWFSDLKSGESRKWILELPFFFPFHKSLHISRKLSARVVTLVSSHADLTGNIKLQTHPRKAKQIQFAWRSFAYIFYILPSKTFPCSLATSSSLSYECSPHLFSEFHVV